ncbi:MAG: inositol monophosphatase [Candidatus Aminicenantes bacterium]|nr:inositol monophosphatase [Candidatus Aminicenantes bacterium]
MDTNDYFQVAVSAALNAGKMLEESMQIPPEITFKGEVNLVTNFDKKAQEMIYTEISEAFPGHDFLAEEGLSKDRGSEFRWIVDPIDGTTNYTHRFPVFCVSIALEWNKKIVLGIIYDPLRKEMFTARTRSGAFLNNKRIEVSSVRNLNESLLSTGFPYDIRESEDNNVDYFIGFLTTAQAVRRTGSAAIDICYVACGRFDGFWEIKLSPWDVAAASLILSEAGGSISDFKGRDYDIFGFETLASNGLIHDQMIEVLQDTAEKKDKKK